VREYWPLILSLQELPLLVLALVPVPLLLQPLLLLVRYPRHR
jgi:hypothetical protein